MSENTEAPVAVEEKNKITLKDIRTKRAQFRREGGVWMSTTELQQAVHGTGYDTYGAWNNWN